MSVYWSAIDTQHSSYEELKHRKVIAQGWRGLGNLSSLLGPVYDDKNTFVRMIQALGDAAYSSDWWHEGENADRREYRTPTVMWNLLHLQQGDLVVAIEGTDVCGICQVTADAQTSYRYDEAYEYAQTVSHPVEWMDWDEERFGFVPTPPSRGLLGIRNLNNEAVAVRQAWAQ